MDSDEALRYFEHGAFLIFRNPPKELEFGIDNHVWTIGPKFMGMKMIPPGLHLISFSLGSVGKQSIFKLFEEREIFCINWIAQTETCDFSENEDHDALERYRSNLRTIDPLLGAYPLDSKTSKYQLWKSLTFYISQKILDKCLPLNSNHLFSSMSGSSYPDETAIDNIAYDEDSTIMFTRFDLRKSYPVGASGPEISRYSQDKSWLLQELIRSSFSSDFKLFLSEFQLSFIILLYGHNFEGYEQWKRFIHLVSFSREALSDPELAVFYLEFIRILGYQLREISEGVFDDLLKQENFLALCLTNFASNMHFYRTDKNKKLEKRWNDFESFILQNFKWNLFEMAKEQEDQLDAEDAEDEAPTIVEL